MNAQTTTEQGSEWTDHDINKAISAESVKVMGGIGIEASDLDRWFIDSGVAAYIARQVRIDYQARLQQAEAERDELRQELEAIKTNGYMPLRDSVGGLINAEWSTPEEDAAWAYLSDESEADSE